MQARPLTSVALPVPCLCLGALLVQIERTNQGASEDDGAGRSSGGGRGDPMRAKMRSRELIEEHKRIAQQLSKPLDVTPKAISVVQKVRRDRSEAAKTHKRRSLSHCCCCCCWCPPLLPIHRTF